jgi:hypothetical protein
MEIPCSGRDHPSIGIGARLSYLRAMLSFIVVCTSLMSHHGVCLSSTCLPIDEDRPIDSFKSCQCHLLHGLFINISIRISLAVHPVVIELVLQLLFVGCCAIGASICYLISLSMLKKIFAGGHEAQG